MYHVFADVGAFAGGEVVSSISNDPLHFDGLVLRKNDDLRVLVANYTPEPRSVRISGISGRFSARSLDETSADAAIRTPEAFRAAPGSLIDAANSNLTIALSPYSVLCLDQV